MRPNSPEPAITSMKKQPTLHGYMRKAGETTATPSNQTATSSTSPTLRVDPATTSTQGSTRRTHLKQTTLTHFSFGPREQNNAGNYSLYQSTESTTAWEKQDSWISPEYYDKNKQKMKDSMYDSQLNTTSKSNLMSPSSTNLMRSSSSMKLPPIQSR